MNECIGNHGPAYGITGNIHRQNFFQSTSLQRTREAFRELNVFLIGNACTENDLGEFEKVSPTRHNLEPKQGEIQAEGALEDQKPT